MSRRHDPFDRQSALASAAFHVALRLVAWVTTLGSTPQMEFITYEIELVSPPPTTRRRVGRPDYYFLCIGSNPRIDSVTGATRYFFMGGRLPT